MIFPQTTVFVEICSRDGTILNIIGKKGNIQPENIVIGRLKWEMIISHR